MFHSPADAGQKNCSFIENNGTTNAKTEETEREINEQITVERPWKGIMCSNI